jgi:hypothetical protein
MFVCCECCVSNSGLCDGFITGPEESYLLWRVVVCDQETSKTRRLKPATGLLKIQPQWVVTPGKQTNKQSSTSTSSILLSIFLLCIVPTICAVRAMNFMMRRSLHFVLSDSNFKSVTATSLKTLGHSPVSHVLMINCITVLGQSFSQYV